MKKMNLQKLVALGSATLACTAALSLTAFAGNWVSDAKGWWYDFGNGTWPSSSWQWIDGNNDGTAECYYFDRFGYCILNGATPDGYQVNENGAWIENGAVQTRNVAVNTAGQNNVASNTKKNTSANASEEVQEDGGEQLVSDKKAKNNAVKLYGKAAIIQECRRESQIRSNREKKTYRDGFSFMHGSFIEFENDGNYSHLKATVFPEGGGWGKGSVMSLEIYNENDDVLYNNDDIRYDTKAFTIDVDISGCEKVGIRGIGGGYSASIGVVHARFE